MAEPASSDRLPRWQVGQTWRVEYRIWQPSPEMGPVHSPPPPQKSVWRYEVLADPPEGGHLLSLKEEDGKRAYQALFDPQDFTLCSVKELVRGKFLPLLENAPHEPRFGYSQAHGVIFDWAVLTEPEARHDFKLADGEVVEQQLTPNGAGGFTVQFRAKEEPDPGFTQITTSTQTWKARAPWWSSAKVQVDYDDKGKQSSLVFIEGTLLPP